MLPRDGSCASARRAPYDDGQICPDSFTDGNFWKTGRSNVVVVTSLATGVVGGQTLIAVGLSD